MKTYNDDIYTKDNIRVTKKRVKQAAAELLYPSVVCKKIDEAKTIEEIDRIMSDARRGKYGTS